MPLVSLGVYHHHSERARTRCPEPRSGSPHPVDLQQVLTLGGRECTDEQARESRPAMIIAHEGSHVSAFSGAPSAGLTWPISKPR